MHSSDAVDPGLLAYASRARCRAEAAEIAAMLEADDAGNREAGALGSTLRQQLHVRATRMEIAVATGLSEGQLRARLATARAARERLPRVWASHQAGGVDGYRVQLVVEALGRLASDASAERLDAAVVPYAESHTTIELKAWLRRFVARAEPDLDAERTARAREDRQVSVRHGEDGMSELWALLPTLQAATIDARLRREAARQPDDGRTRAQKRADLLAAWATHSEDTVARPAADIAVVIPLDALTRATDETAAESADGSWVVPAREIRDLVASGATTNVFWHRLITDPAGRVLDHTYLGRFAPAVLAKAVAFRDGVCQAPGCTVPASQCDLDHRRPWPEGRTSGSEIWPLCRRHHALKSHGYLTPVERVPLPMHDLGAPPSEYGWRLPSGRILRAERPVRGPTGEAAAGPSGAHAA
ncbi:DUF222 domain-containing protein [Mumia sp. DW29H23]|uniref:HNH endonuclease signature motif containing protein n=1 Tax=Mumia sp. DW29H23 TaxID=3421241 RepID=UPI003D68DA70